MSRIIDHLVTNSDLCEQPNNKSSPEAVTSTCCGAELIYEYPVLLDFLLQIRYNK